jgi:hypothetical protein
MPAFAFGKKRPAGTTRRDSTILEERKSTVAASHNVFIVDIEGGGV